VDPPQCDALLVRQQRDAFLTLLLGLRSRPEQNPYADGSRGVIQRAMIVCPVTLIKVRPCSVAPASQHHANGRLRAQNWSAEIKKWLGRDKLRVYVADAQHPVSTFARNKSYDVLIVGYDKVSRPVPFFSSESSY